VDPEKKHKGEQKRRYEAKKIMKTAKLERSRFKKKEKEFWDYVRQFQIVRLVETWVEERSWEKIETRKKKGILEIFEIDILGLLCLCVVFIL
jgi:hypothetical protein